jgi:hypothetical protein
VLADRENLTRAGTKGVKADDIPRVLAADNKLLISTPSYASAAKYAAIASPPKASEFSLKLDNFRKLTGLGAFVLVGRVDGIDLPHATCRVMLADGLPSAFSLIEIHLYDVIEMRNSFAAKLANRITQLFGRVNRGRNDYSVIFATDSRLINWLSAPRNVALLPELLRKQLLLGKSLVDQFGINDIGAFPALIKQVVNRDSGWLTYYKDSIGGLELSEDQRKQAKEVDDALTKAALAEAEFAAHMWDGAYALAREALGSVVDQVVVADRRLAGWYNIQLGHTLELEGDGESAAKQYSQARSRIHHILALPFPVSTTSIAQNQEPRNLLHRNLLDILNNDVRTQNDHIHRLDRTILPLFDTKASAGQHEEAMRGLGELLGFHATRPEQEDDSGSKLDVLWRASTSEAILIELKTKKKVDSPINKDDIGQGFNHLQWASDTLKGKVLGLVFVSTSERCSKDASPSDQMWVTTLGTVRTLFEETTQMLRALQRMNPLERYAEIEALCTRAEWQPENIFRRICGHRLADLKT